MLTASTPGVNLAMWLYKPLNCCCSAAPRFGGAESPHSHYFKPGHSSESNVKASSVDWMLSGLKTTQDSFTFHHFRHGCLPSAASRIQVCSFLGDIGNFLLASESSKGPLSPNLKPCKYVRIYRQPEWKVRGVFLGCWGESARNSKYSNLEENRNVAGRHAQERLLMQRWLAEILVYAVSIEMQDSTGMVTQLHHARTCKQDKDGQSVVRNAVCEKSRRV